MANILSILRNFWSSLISYLKLSKRELNAGVNPIKKQLAEYELIKKQLQQRNNLLISLLLHVFTWYHQIETQIKDAKNENNSLKQALRELQQQSITIESERDEAKEISAKLRLENILLEQKVEQLESHKKVLIQELSGSLTGQDIEFITWEFLIQKVKEVTNHLNEVIAYNQSLIKTNRDLHQERDVLRKELNQVKDNNTRLTKDNLQLQTNKYSIESERRRILERIKPLERANEKLEQEKDQLERKIEALNKVEYKLGKAEAEVEQLGEKIQELEQNKQHLEIELKQEKAKVAPFEQKNKNLEQVRNQLETALKQEKSRVAVLEREANDLRRCKKKGGSESEDSTDGNDKLFRETSQLNQTIKQLEEGIKQLEKKHNHGFSEQDQECSNCDYNQLDILDEIDLLELYNDLVYFVQKSLTCSGLERLDNWEKNEEFYVEIISRLCFIDTILVVRIKSLEDQSYFIDKENNQEQLKISFSYLGKALFWSNGELYDELHSSMNSKF